VEPLTIVVIVLGVLVVLLALEIPVAFALIGSGTLGLVMLRGPAVAGAALGSVPFQAASMYTLSVVPMFILMGMLAMQGNVAEDLFRSANRLFRGVRGGAAIATVATCAGFAAVCGSSVATAATVGRLTIDEMRRYGHEPAFAAAVVATAGTLGVLIPPSIVMVLFGIITNESIGRLLLAGVIPGIVSAIMLSIGILVFDRIGIGRAPAGSPPAPAPTPVDGGSVPRHDGQFAWAGVLRICLLFFIVIGGIYSGLVTATEAAATGALAALLILLHRVFRERIPLWPALAEALRGTASVTSMVFAVVIGASILSYFFVLAGVPTAVTQWMLGLDLPPRVLVLLLLLALLPLGMFLDGVSILLITVPLTYPVVKSLGFDGVWYAVLVVKMIEIGLITPPVGVNVFVVANCVKGTSLERVFRAITVFVALDLLIFMILFSFPVLSTWLPDRLQ
jgi:C4-dicarboxylate transporter DctM subunit